MCACRKYSCCVFLALSFGSLTIFSCLCWTTPSSGFPTSSPKRHPHLRYPSPKSSTWGVCPKLVEAVLGTCNATENVWSHRIYVHCPQGKLQLGICKIFRAVFRLWLGFYRLISARGSQVLVKLGIFWVFSAICRKVRDGAGRPARQQHLVWILVLLLQGLGVDAFTRGALNFSFLFEVYITSGLCWFQVSVAMQVDENIGIVCVKNRSGWESKKGQFLAMPPFGLYTIKQTSEVQLVPRTTLVVQWTMWHVLLGHEIPFARASGQGSSETHVVEENKKKERELLQWKSIESVKSSLSPLKFPSII